MATIFNAIDKVAGDPQVTASVKIELVWNTTVYPIAKRTDDDVTINGFYIIDVDETGSWTTSLVPNDNIFPADSLYKITESITEVDATTESLVYYISLPDGASPTYWVGDLIVTVLPDWI